MVWPHNNDIGKEKPEEPAIPSWASFPLKEMDAELLAMSSEAFAKAMQAMPLYGIEQQSTWLKPKNVPYVTHAEAKQKFYESLFPQNSKPDPVLIDGPKGNYEFYDNNPGLPTSIPLKQIRMVLRFDGPNELIKDKLGSSYLLPPKEITESELRRILQEQFKSMEDLIINNLKKAKGIK